MVEENIFAHADMGFLKAMAMYDVGFVGFRRTLSPFFYCGRRLIGGRLNEQQGLGRSGIDTFSFVCHC